MIIFACIPSRGWESSSFKQGEHKRSSPSLCRRAFQGLSSMNFIQYFIFSIEKQFDISTVKLGISSHVPSLIIGILINLEMRVTSYNHIRNITHRIQRYWWSTWHYKKITGFHLCFNNRLCLCRI